MYMAEICIYGPGLNSTMIIVLYRGRELSSLRPRKRTKQSNLRLAGELGTKSYYSGETGNAAKRLRGNTENI